MNIEVEFILIGVGVNDGVDKTNECSYLPDCPKGAPTFRNDDDDPDYADDGYKKIQGDGNPMALGGKRFDTEREALDWLSSKPGIRFKRIFLSVFIARVVK